MKASIKVIALLLLLSIPVLSQGQRAQVYEMGPDVWSNVQFANGYQWRAWGWVYGKGAFNGRGACYMPEEGRGNGAPIVGYWAAQGWKGDAASHSAQYRVTLYNKGTFYFRGDVVAVDEDGAAASTLFELASFQSGQLIGFDAPSFAEYTPHSPDCFGGSLKLYLSQ